MRTRYLASFLLALLAVPAILRAGLSSRHDLDGVSLHVPFIDAGTGLLAATEPGVSEPDLKRTLEEAFGLPAGTVLAHPAEREGALVDEIASLHPGAEIFRLEGILPASLRSLFNQPTGFAGPNCFATALLAAGFLPREDRRHVATEEIQAVVEMYYRKIPRQQIRRGDLVLFDDWDHMACYLGAGLVIHKKSYLKQHLVRVVPMMAVYEDDPGEWTPGPFDDAGPWRSGQAIRKVEVFRRQDASYQLDGASERERARVAVVQFLLERVLEHAPAWKVGRELGYATECLAEGLVRRYEDMGESRNEVVRACYSQIPSIRDQLNQSIEQEFFSSRHAQSRYQEIIREIWLPRNDTLRTLIGLLRRAEGLEADTGTVERILEAVAAAVDRPPLDTILAR